MRIALIVGCLYPLLSHADGSFEHALQLIEAWQIDAAERELAAIASARPTDLQTIFLDGRIAFERGEYARAVQQLDTVLAKLRPGPQANEAKMLRDLAAATLEVTRGYAHSLSPAGHFALYYSPRDALLAPYAGEALERAYQALAEDFAERPTSPVRVEIYPEVADLAKVSTLTVQEIERTGTIALCKFNRLMIVTPRTLIAGYPWLDTLNHEYTHFIVSRASSNSVPIWLQEGLAKFEERRWQGIAGGTLPPMMEHLLAQAVAKQRFITFAQMHPSMAKLPSQHDGALAFAEVYSTVIYLRDKIGWAGLRKLIATMRESGNDAAAIQAVTGRSFSEFERDWRSWLAAKGLKTHTGLVARDLKFKHGAKDEPDPSGDDPTAIRDDKARASARLGGLLRARHRLQAAAAEYEKAQTLLGAGHPQVAPPLARTYLELRDPKRAIGAALPSVEKYPDLASAKVTAGTAYFQIGDLDRAEKMLTLALAVNPFNPEVHCQLAEIYQKRTNPRGDREAKACRELRH